MMNVKELLIEIIKEVDLSEAWISFFSESPDFSIFPKSKDIDTDPNAINISKNSISPELLGLVKEAFDKLKLDKQKL
jgi:hypothetical protein